MVRCLLPMFLILLSTSGYSQKNERPFLSYLQNVNIAENYIANGSYDSAIVSYLAAFNLHNPIAVDIYNAFLVAKESKDRFAAEQFLWQLASKGVGRSFFEKNRYINSYRNNSNWKKWLTKADSEKMKIRIANQEVISRIERISFSAENLYRIWVKSLEGKTGTKETDFELQLDEQNNILIDSLLSIIHQFGYPSEERIGVRIVNDTNILSEPVFSKIILRGYSKPNGIGGGTFDEILKNAMDSGFIKPFFFARMHDYKHYQNYTPYGTSFFTGLGGKIYYSDKDDISQIEEDRRQIGLSSLLEYAKIIQYTQLNKGSSFLFDILFTKQDRLLDTEKDRLEYIQNHKEYVPENFE